MSLQFNVPLPWAVSFLAELAHIDTDGSQFEPIRDIFLPPAQLSTTQLNASLDLNATDGSGHALFGSGNPSTGWEVQNTSHFQLGSNVHYRTGDTIQPTSVEHDGDLVYQAPAGPQVVDSAHNVSSANANRGATSFDYEFSTGHGPTAGQETIQHFLAHGGSFEFKIDLDPSIDTNFLTLHAVYDPVHNTGGSHVVWEDKNGTIVIADDGGNAYVTENSQNLAFYKNLIDIDPNTPGIQVGDVSPAGQYDIVEKIIDNHHTTVASIHSDLFLV